jgi:hypothetical protein
MSLVLRCRRVYWLRGSLDVSNSAYESTYDSMHDLHPKDPLDTNYNCLSTHFRKNGLKI